MPNQELTSFNPPPPPDSSPSSQEAGSSHKKLIIGIAAVFLIIFLVIIVVIGISFFFVLFNQSPEARLAGYVDSTFQEKEAFHPSQASARPVEEAVINGSVDELDEDEKEELMDYIGDSLVEEVESVGESIGDEIGELDDAELYTLIYWGSEEDFDPDDLKYYYLSSTGMNSLVVISFVDEESGQDLAYFSKFEKNALDSSLTSREELADFVEDYLEEPPLESDYEEGGYRKFFYQSDSRFIGVYGGYDKAGFVMLEVTDGLDVNLTDYDADELYWAMS